MSHPSETTPLARGDPDRLARLEEELRKAYHALGEVSSRLLLVSEAAESLLGTHDRTEVSRRFLEVVARAVAVRRSALFLHDGQNLLLGAANGLSPGEEEALIDNAEAVEVCDRALERNQPLILDPELVMGSGGMEGEELAEAEEARGEEHGADLAASEALDAGEDVDADGDEEAGAGAPEGAVSAPPFGVFLPAILEGEPVAVLALGERGGGSPYSSDDLALCSHLLAQLAVAVQRCVLLEKSEERVRELDALLRVSREITSTLDLDVVLRGIVNTAGAVVENDRCELFLLEGGSLKLRAVTGLTRIPGDLVETYGLKEVSDWLRLTSGRVQISADDLGAEREIPGREVFHRYFESQPMRAFMALPLKDEQGLLGFLCLESRQESWDLDPQEGDVLDILAAQTTVAIRNASLYGRIPLRGVALPVARAQAGWKRISVGKRRLLLGAGVATAVLVLLPIFPERAAGPCEVLPARSYTVRAETDGVVRTVAVRGGEMVQAGQALALLEDPDLSARLSRLRGELQSARVQAAMAQERGDPLQFRLQQLEAQNLGEQLALESNRAGRTRLRAPVAGRILDLNLVEQEGRYLEAGAAFCRLSDLGRMRAEVLVDEKQVGRLRIGARVRLKVAAYPTRAFEGRVTEVGWQAENRGARRGFRVRADLANPDLMLRPGMSGQAKVQIGRRPLLGMLLEPFVRQARLAWW